MSGLEEKLPLYKIVLAGDVGVGKTSIFQRYDTNKFFDHKDVTFGLDKLNKNVEVDGQKCKVCFIISSTFHKLDNQLNFKLITLFLHLITWKVELNTNRDFEIWIEHT